MLTFIQALARQEGAYAKGPTPTLPERRDNPGDIEDGEFAQAHGALPSDGNRFAAFPTMDAGFAADRVLLDDDYVGLTILQAIHKYAPAIENADDIYVRHVCTWTGLTPATVLTKELIG